MSPVMDGLVPITIVAIVFTTCAAVAIALIFAVLKKRRIEIDAYKAAVEKGLPVPEFKIKTRERSPISTLKAALVWIAVGAGLIIPTFLAAFEDGDYGVLAFSTIPIFIGIALVISYVVEKKEREKEKSESL
ncbi:MAG: hypothetical protein GY839_07100 [candidate division Zixibacteria bacterium]|nr:hypothetical protein [candidate division Zixibacteria bacterium]